jgi:hypothetical protein
MNFNDLVVADGLIKKMTWKFGFSEITFDDYLGTRFNLIFRKVISIEIVGPCIGFSLRGHKVEISNPDGLRFSFFDEDGNHVTITTQAGNLNELCVVS